jgi:hydrogenase maturation factor
VGFRERGVTAMHDVTEGGLFGALYEFSLASRVGLEIQLREIIVPKEARLVCDLFDLSPYSTLGEGSLIICAKPEKAETILETLKRTGIPCAVIGKTTNQRSGRWIRTDGKKARLEKPGSDPYWEAYWKACKKGWK